jgi:hypothetical protein
MKKFSNHHFNPKLLEGKVYKRRNEIKNRKSKGYLYSNKNKNTKVLIKVPISAPKVFSLIKNPDECLLFFNRIRTKDNHSIIKGRFVMRISLSRIKEIDFATISILKSIFEESKYYGIKFSSNLPKDTNCKNFLIESGFLNNLFDEKMQEIQIKGNGKHFNFEKKQGKLRDRDLEDFEKLSDEVYSHVMKSNDGYCDELITLLKEIGGNAIEWSDSYNNQWQIGILNEVEKVTINITDLGRGILETLYVSNKLKFIDLFLLRNDLDTLDRAFDRKYGSLSQEINRNRGLPSIRRIFKENKIAKLVVCSNSVFLDFENYGNSFTTKSGELNFMGTFYQWEINRACIE